MSSSEVAGVEGAGLEEQQQELRSSSATGSSNSGDAALNQDQRELAQQLAARMRARKKRVPLSERAGRDTPSTQRSREREYGD